MEKLAPLPKTLNLNETREHLNSELWGKHGVAKPYRTDKCWAEILIRVPFGRFDYYGLNFQGCENKARERFLTCSIHDSRELAARELKCELENVSMSDLAYIDEADEAADRKRRRDEMLRKWRQKRQSTPNV